MSLFIFCFAWKARICFSVSTHSVTLFMFLFWKIPGAFSCRRLLRLLSLPRKSYSCFNWPFKRMRYTPESYLEQCTSVRVNPGAHINWLSQISSTLEIKLAAEIQVVSRARALLNPPSLQPHQPCRDSLEREVLVASLSKHTWD